MKMNTYLLLTAVVALMVCWMAYAVAHPSSKKKPLKIQSVNRVAQVTFQLDSTNTLTGSAAGFGH